MYWGQARSQYIHKDVHFTGPLPGPPHISRELPSEKQLFHKFFSKKTLTKICRETNRYAASIDPSTGCTRGPVGWWRLRVPELEAWLGICILMALKVMPNRRCYWVKSDDFYYCTKIGGTMWRKRFEAITKCLHIHNDSRAPTDKDDPQFDKLIKIRWLLEEVRGRCISNWNVGKYVTIDELMVRYKGIYGHGMKQYLPSKPVKFGFKVWAAADADSKYLYNFQVSFIILVHNVNAWICKCMYLKLRFTDNKMCL